MIEKFCKKSYNKSEKIKGEQMIIDIEGIDGSGKKVQSERLLAYLEGRGFRCRLISFPNYDSPSSQPVKMYLNGDLGENDSLNGFQASALFAVDRLATMRTLDWQQYDYLIMDRYTPSNMIHQSTRITDPQQLDQFLDWVADFEYNKLALPQPDCTLFLNLPFETSQRLIQQRNLLKSGQKRDVLELDADHLRTAHERAVYVAKKFGWTTINCVDDTGTLMSIDTIHQLILNNLGL